MSWLSSLNGCELITLANTVSILLAQDLTENEITALANFFTIIGDSLTALATTPNNNCLYNKKPE